MRMLDWRLVAAGVILACIACKNADAPTSPDAIRGGTGLTNLPAASSFEPRSDNPYFPLIPGTIYHYETQTDEGLETDDFYVTHSTKVINGVTVRVIRDVVRLEGEVTEFTFDWFAQDDAGNVWYFGEDSRTIEDGKVVSTEGSWMAGRDGAQPGIVMEAHPQVGDKYQEENAPGVAQDRAEVLSLTESVQVPFGSFTNCLKTRNTTPLEPDVIEEKYYCLGVGSVKEIDVAPDPGTTRLISITHDTGDDH